MTMAPVSVPSAKRTLLAFPLILIAAFVFILVVTAPPSTPRFHLQRSAMQQTRIIGMMLVAYAKDHHGTYPQGESSTEIFQKLIDGGYTNDSTVFYTGASGKSPATSKQLESKNVSFDITAPLDANSSSLLPVIFSTGFKMNYVPGGNAVPLKPSWDRGLAGIAVFYQDNHSTFMNHDGKPDQVVEHVVPQDFKDNGVSYRQLTPEGPLAP